MGRGQRRQGCVSPLDPGPEPGAGGNSSTPAAASPAGRTSSVLRRCRGRGGCSPLIPTGSRLPCMKAGAGAAGGERFPHLYWFPAHRAVLAVGALPGMSDCPQAARSPRSKCWRGPAVCAFASRLRPAPGGLGLRVGWPAAARGSGGVTRWLKGGPCRSLGLHLDTLRCASDDDRPGVLILGRHLCLGPGANALPPSHLLAIPDEQATNPAPGALLRVLDFVPGRAVGSGSRLWFCGCSGAGQVC